MKVKSIHSLLLVFLLLPMLLANKGCGQATTWGKNKYYAQWAEDHAGFDKDTACADCHDGRDRKTKPRSHQATSWMKDHGGYGNIKYGFKNDNVCYLCHAESQCTTCHQQEAPQSHTEFWKLKGHGAMVGLNRTECTTCHQDTEFCERCHSTTTPATHTATWGSPSNNHCLSCHFPLNSAGAQQCAACHRATPSHDAAPARPNNALHAATAVCLSCHAPLHHPDNGMTCVSCH